MKLTLDVMRVNPETHICYAQSIAYQIMDPSRIITSNGSLKNALIHECYSPAPLYGYGLHRFDIVRFGLKSGKCFFCAFTDRRDSSVGKTSGDGLDEGRQDLLHSVLTDSEAYPASYTTSIQSSSPGVKWQVRETDHSPPPGAQVKKSGDTHSLLYMFS
jgi:hypothetical protein